MPRQDKKHTHLHANAWALGHTHTYTSESESESEWDLLPSRFTPTWNFFWCIGAYSKHKNIQTQ